MEDPKGFSTEEGRWDRGGKLEGLAANGVAALGTGSERQRWAFLSSIAVPKGQGTEGLPFEAPSTLLHFWPK